MKFTLEDPIISFKYEFEGKIIRELKSPRSISNPKTKKEKRELLIWDTGATISCISSRVAFDLGLEIEGIEAVGTADGVVSAHRHKAHIILRETNNKEEKHFQILKRAISLDLNGENILGLIGMDIIGLGSFLIHYNASKNKHTLQFSYPELKKLNKFSFQDEADKQNKTALKKFKDD